MKLVGAILIVLAAGAAGLGIFIWSGAYDIGADKPHDKPVARAIAALRDQSIASHSRGVDVPKLDDARMIGVGAREYSDMCEGCHLGPGVAQSEIRAGLYPQPPDLTKAPVADPRATFWTIKHGIKMSAMPAWGVTHDDQTIWDIVAFVGRMPKMSAAEYHALLARTPSDPEHAHSPDRGHSDSMGPMRSP